MSRTFVAALALGLSVLAAAPAVAAPAAPCTRLFVSPTGDDRGPGTPQRPLRTLEHARDVVRGLTAGMRDDIEVTLLPGTYRLAAPLTFDAADSGRNGHRVLWTAAPGAHPVLSGGRRITGWTQADPAKNIWTAPAPGLTSRQLYVDGVRAQRAQGPLPVKLTATATGYTADSDAMASWRNPGGIEFGYPGGDGFWSLRTGGLGGWTEPRCPVGAISGTTITMAQPCWDNSTKRVMRTDTSGRTVNLVGPASLGNGKIPAYAENAYELLDQPGEWYLDAGRLSYIPRAGERLATADVEIPVLEKLLDVQGTADVTFRGLQFAYATWLTPSTGEGFSEIQANFTITGPTGYATQGLCQFLDGGTCPFGNWTKLPGNVSVAHAQRIAFLDDAFVHLGAAGLDLGHGVQDTTVSGSVFTDISGNGVEIGAVDNPLPATQAEHTSNVQLLNNHLYSLPVEYRGGVAIDVGYAERTLISHNRIDRTAYTAISLGWGGWPDKIGVSATPNYSHDNVVSQNLITDPMQLLADGGAIYTQGITGTSLADGEKVTGNVILDSLGHGHAIYSDNGATYMTISGNVLFGNQNDWGSRHTDYQPGHTGYDPTVVSGNYWQQGDADSSDRNVTVSGNHIISGLADVPAATLDAAGLERAYRSLPRQRFSARAVPDAPAQAAAFGTGGAAYVAWNPSFVDHGDAVTSYTVTASPGGQTASVNVADFKRLGYAIVPGLTNGTAYTFTVTATSARGVSVPSLPTAAVKAVAGPGAVPGAPTSLKLAADGANVRLSWNPPSSVGGTPVIGYTISAPGIAPVHYTGHFALWANSSRTTFTTIGGLTPKTPYTFRITAGNVAGSSAPAEATVIPGTSAACAGAKLTLSPSSVVGQAGGTVRVTTTLANGCTTTLSGAKVYLQATNGYQVSPGSADAGDVAVGGSAASDWTVTIPAGATASGQLRAFAVFDSAGQAQVAEGTGVVTLPKASFEAALDNVGVTDDAAPALGNFDGAGSSFSAPALAAAGVVPGGPVTSHGVTFTWPAAVGTPGNVVADGTAFALTGTGTTLSFLVSAGYGPASGTGTVVYTDGSTVDFTLSSPDWHAACTSATAPGVAVYTPYRNRATGKNALAVCAYYASVPLQADRTVAQVLLPNVSTGVTSGAASLHVFAVAIS